MKNFRRVLSVLLVAALIIACVTACKDDDQTREPGDGASDKSADNYEPFSYGLGLDENGMLEGVTALDYVDLFNYIGIEIPASVWMVSEDDVLEHFDRSRMNYVAKESDRITDRPIEDKDFVNLDFIGSVDNVEFEGGNSFSFGDDGFNVTAGTEQFIDDFLIQIIGSSPGDELSVTVTFPEVYHDESLAGKEATFEVTINHIISKEPFEKEFRDNAIETYVKETYINPLEVEVIPDSVIESLVENSVRYYAEEARADGLSLLEYINLNFGYESIDEIFEAERKDAMDYAKMLLVLQALVEDIGVSATDEDVRNFLINLGPEFDEDRIAQTIEDFTMPYLKQVVLHRAVWEHIVGEAILLEPTEDELNDGEDDDEDEDEDGEDE